MHPMPPAPTSCVFCAIARGDAPAAVVLRTEGLCAFLDARPVFKGHVLIIPEAHVPDLDSLEQVGALFELAQRVSRAVQVALGAQGTFVAVNNKISQSVPHLHVHVVPRSKGDGLRGFFWPRGKYDSDQERDQVARALAAALAALPARS